jgi:hypothetical protein
MSMQNNAKLPSSKISRRTLICLFSFGRLKEETSETSTTSLLWAPALAAAAQLQLFARIFWRRFSAAWRAAGAIRENWEA